MVSPPPLLDISTNFPVEENPDEALTVANLMVTSAMVVSMTKHVPPIDNIETSAIPHIILTDNENPMAELEDLLSGSIKSTPKSDKSSSNESLDCPLDIIGFINGAIEILNHPFDILASDHSLQDHLSVILDKLLNCQSQLPESAKLLPLLMKTALTELMTKFPSTQRVITEYK